VGPREGRERRTVADAPDQAERRFRPRARRARSTARPPLVRMRRRNPWVLARLRLFGWYVRFNEEPPRGAARSPRSGTAREAETAKCTARIARFATQRDLWGKRPRPLVAQGHPVLRCALRSATARRAGLPRSVTTGPGRHLDHSWDDLHTCGRSCGQPPATADAPGSADQQSGRRWWTVVEKKNGER
jgi:hypothetical protein